MALSAICDERSSKAWDLPDLSLVGKDDRFQTTAQLRSDFCNATRIGCKPSVESFHSSVVWKDNGTVTMYGTTNFFNDSIAFG